MFGNFMHEFDEDPFFNGMPSSMIIPREEMGHSQRGRMEEMNPFGHISKQMQNLHNGLNSRMELIDTNKNNGQTYCQRTVMSYHNDGKSKPKVYQASTSTRTAPGQVKEVRRTVRDSERGIQKMSIGHHIGNRARILERRRVRGNEEEERNYVQMNEDDEPDFELEWNEKSKHFIDGSSRNHPPPVTARHSIER